MNVRTRALCAFMIPWGDIAGGFLIGYFLDNRRMSIRQRARWSWIGLMVLNLALWYVESSPDIHSIAMANKSPPHLLPTSGRGLPLSQSSLRMNNRLLTGHLGLYSERHLFCLSFLISRQWLLRRLCTGLSAKVRSNLLLQRLTHEFVYASVG